MMKRDQWTPGQLRLPIALAALLPLMYLVAGCGGTAADAQDTTSSESRAGNSSSSTRTREGSDDEREGTNRTGGDHEGDSRHHEEGDDDDDDGEHHTRLDAGQPAADAGQVVADAGMSRPDSGPRPDSGTLPPPRDAGTVRPDAGQTPPPDAGTVRPDAGQTPPPDAGQTPPPDAGTVRPDAGPTSPPDAGTSSQPDAGTPTCINAATPGDGHHNAGADCLSCHANFSGSLQWTLAGTLYSTVTGGSPVTGATIEVTDAHGQVIRLVTATNGNFYTNQAVAFPVRVRASRCPSDVSMGSSPAMGGCNSCHNASFRIHLP